MVPWYLTVKQAAAVSGIGEKTLRSYVNSADPPPMKMIGNKYMLERDGLKEYLHERQEVKSAKK